MQSPMGEFASAPPMPPTMLCGPQSAARDVSHIALGRALLATTPDAQVALLAEFGTLIAATKDRVRELQDRALVTLHRLRAASAERSTRLTAECMPPPGDSSSVAQPCPVAAGA